MDNFLMDLLPLGFGLVSADAPSAQPVAPIITDATGHYLDLLTVAGNAFERQKE